MYLRVKSWGTTLQKCVGAHALCPVVLQSMLNSPLGHSACWSTSQLPSASIKGWTDFATLENAFVEG